MDRYNKYDVKYSGVVPYVGNIGMCGAKGMAFQPFCMVINRVSFFALVTLNSVFLEATSS